MIDYAQIHRDQAASRADRELVRTVRDTLRKELDKVAGDPTRNESYYFTERAHLRQLAAEKVAAKVHGWKSKADSLAALREQARNRRLGALNARVVPAPAPLKGTVDLAAADRDAAVAAYRAALADADRADRDAKLLVLQRVALIRDNPTALKHLADHANARGDAWTLGVVIDAADGIDRPSAIRDVRAYTETVLDTLPLPEEQQRGVQALDSLQEDVEYMINDLEEIATGDESVGDRLDTEAAYREAANEHGVVDGPRRVVQERARERQARAQRIKQPEPRTEDPFAALAAQPTAEPAAEPEPVSA